MAKKLLHKYSFTPSTKTIVIDGMYNLERFLLISNLTTNETIFTFNDNVNGLASHSIDHPNETTTVVLDYDTTAMNANDNLQIFIEMDNTSMRPEEAFVDPVHKFRVSNPENLIDTDFEYGLQSSKWETLELSNNVPSFYGKNGDYTLLGINIVRATSGSDIVRVTCTDPHRISTGTPIDVQGLTSLTAEGKYLVADVEDDFVFTYKSRGVQATTANIKTPYTTIVPGQFYTGADVNFVPEDGIQTDTQNESKLTMTTSEAHGFESGSKFYFLNTVSPKTLVLDEPPTDTAGDGFAYVDIVDTETANVNIDNAKTDTKAVKGAYELRFNADAVDQANSTITWNGHGFRENDTILYVKPAGTDTPIGGLNSLDFYWITNPTTNTFQLKSSYGGAPVSFTSTGTYDHGEAVMMIAYEMRYMRSQWYTNNLYWRTWGHDNGASSNFSGWDLATTQYGKMQSRPDYTVPVHARKSSTSTSWRNYPYYGFYNYGTYWGQSYDNDMRLADNHATYPHSFNFVEDFQRYNNPHFDYPATSSYLNWSTGTMTWSSTGYYYYDGTWYFGHGDFFFVPVNDNDEAYTFYEEQHGFTNGQSVNFTYTGNPIYYYTHGRGNYSTNYTPSSLSAGTYQIEVVDENRFRIKSGTTNIRIAAATGNYTFTGIRQRPTRDTFYIENHGLAENNSVTAGTEFGARLPDTTTGNISFTSSNSDLEVFKTTIDSAVEAFRQSLASQADMVMDGTTRNTPFRYATGSSANSTMQQGFNMYLRYYDNTWSSWTISGNNWNTGAYDTGEVEDAAQGYPVSGQGHAVIMTPFVQDSEIPFWSAATKNPLNRYGYSNFDVRFSISNSYTINARNTNNTNPTVWTTVGVNGVAGGVTTDWRFARVAQYTNPTGRDCILQYQISIKKDDWDSYSFNGQSYNRDNSPAYAYMTSNGYNHLDYTCLIRIPDAITIDTTFLQNLDAYIMDTIYDGFTYPALTAGNTYKVQVVDDSRFRLKSTGGVPVNLTTSGIAGQAGDTALTITNDATSFYVVDGANNDTIYVKPGYTYTFSISAAGHPFWIQTTDPATAGYDSGNTLGTDDGITNNGTENGTLIWTVPEDYTEGTYYYVCQNHAAQMNGEIVVTSNPAALTFLDVSNQIGTLDGVYTVSATPNDTTIEFQTNFKAGSKVLQVSQSAQTDNDHIFISAGHNLADGTPIVYDPNGNAVWANFINGQTYFVTVIDDQYIQLSDSESNRRDAIFMELDWTTIPSSDHNIISTTVNGLVPISPTVDVESGSKNVDGGADSIFLTYYKAGDNFILKDPSTTPGKLTTYTIASVVDDSTITLTESVGFTSSAAVHLVPTKVYTRPDGASTHRPFDGGVEIIAGSAPGSQIVRQTRKYFRYQSGKGIQISLAINFNPPLLVETISVVPDTKCERDIGYIAQGAALEVALGGTFHAYFHGLAELRSLYLNPVVNQRIEKVRDDILALPQVDDSATAETRVTSYFTEILDIIDNTATAADAPVYTDPSAGRTSGQLAARDQLIANKDFIIAELAAYIDDTYPNTTWDTTTLLGDITMLNYAIAYDMSYGGNFASYQMAVLIMYVTNQRVYGTHNTESLAVLNRYLAIIGDIVQEVAVTATTGNTETQDTNGTPAGASEATEVEGLLQIVIDGVTYGTSATEFTGTHTKTKPSITWANSEVQDAATDIENNISTLSVSYATRIQTKYPNYIKAGQLINISDSDVDYFNGDFTVTTYIDDFTFQYSLPGTPPTFNPSGVVQFRPKKWENSAVRCGLYDFQNGFFYEYDGETIYAVRRNSTMQLSGTASATFKSNVVSGANTDFVGQLNVGDMIVLRGQSYKVTSIGSKQDITIQPKYKGATTDGIIVTKTIDYKIAQQDWNMDVADGNGPSNFLLDITKIQMAYMDYSWYGAGKIRFGFKDTYGHVVYCHEMLHNNRETEAYMRSGNIPARYEIENTGITNYQPRLFHWGTSVIMDGTFDDDKAYLFTASSNTLSFTNGQSLSATTTQNSSLVGNYSYTYRTREWFVELKFNTSDASKFSVGTPLYTSNGELNGETVHSTYFSGSTLVVRLFIARRWNRPSIYPSVSSGVSVSIGAPASGGTDQSLLGDIPLISIRLAPSVDNGITGNIGERDIINRMQLQLKQIGLVLTHDCEVRLILNGSLSNINFTKVQSPSLSNLVTHDKADTITGGTPIFTFRASGGSETSGARLSNATDFDLTDITDLGNSILGGDGVFPNGPDLLTIAVKIIDTSDISANSPFEASGRITWSESQA